MAGRPGYVCARFCPRRGKRGTAEERSRHVCRHLFGSPREAKNLSALQTPKRVSPLCAIDESGVMHATVGTLPRRRRIEHVAVEAAVCRPGLAVRVAGILRPQHLCAAVRTGRRPPDGVLHLSFLAAPSSFHLDRDGDGARRAQGPSSRILLGVSHNLRACHPCHCMSVLHCTCHIPPDAWLPTATMGVVAPPGLIQRERVSFAPRCAGDLQPVGACVKLKAPPRRRP